MGYRFDSETGDVTHVPIEDYQEMKNELKEESAKEIEKTIEQLESVKGMLVSVLDEMKKVIEITQKNLTDLGID